MRNPRAWTVLLALLGALLGGCSTAPGGDPADPDAEQSRFQVLARSTAASALSSMVETSAAGDYLALTLFVSEVRLQHAGGWEVLAQYEPPLELELLGLQGEIELADTLIGPGDYAEAQLRLVLAGAQLQVEDAAGAGVTHELRTPSAEESGLKLGPLAIAAGEGVALLLEFDPEASVVRTGNEGYLLKPVVTVSLREP